MNTGVLSHKSGNCTHLGKFIAFYLRFMPVYKFVSSTSSSPVYQLHGPSTRGGTYFYRSRAEVFPVGRRCYTISSNISTWFIVCFCHLYFVFASLLQSIKLQRSLGDANAQDSILWSIIQFLQTVCDRTFILLKSHYKQVSHQFRSFQGDSLFLYELSILWIQ